MKLIFVFAMLLGFTLSASAGEFNQRMSQSVVEVTGSTSRGNGVLFLLNGQLRVLTNAHIVGNDSQVSISAEDIQTPYTAYVETVLGAEDLAVLTLGNPRETWLTERASETLRICTNTSDGLCDRLPQYYSINTGVGEYSGEDRILTMDNDVSRILTPQAAINGAERRPDTFISGSYRYVWYLRILVPNGVSGGAYFKFDTFAGLVTKVSRGMQSYAIAIPRDEIARVLKASSGRRERVQFAEGGDPGNGGGEVQGSGNNTQQTRWRLERPGCSNLLRCPGESEIIDPFANALTAQTLNLGGQAGSIIQVGSTYQAASQARFTSLNQQRQRVQLLDINSPEISRLLARRQTRALMVPHLRVWRKDAPGVLRNMYPVTGSHFDGVITLGNMGTSLGSDRRMYVGEYHPSIQVGIGRDTSFQVVLDEQDQRLVVARDLSRVWIGNRDGSSGGFLTPQSMINPTKRLYTSASGNARALMVYNDSDLTRLETIIFETPAFVYEFRATDPNRGQR